MAAKIGIAQNVVTTFAGFRQDRRGVRKVEETRSMNNMKPFRSKALKAKARKECFLMDGTHCSNVKVEFHGAGTTDRISGSFVSV